MELPSREACYRALQSRDSRFDGLMFVGISSTGIYCRPICPARTAKFENCTFFGSAAAAQDAGFRPCLRCRPETAPDLASWRGTSNTVSRRSGAPTRIMFLETQTPRRRRSRTERCGMYFSVSQGPTHFLERGKKNSFDGTNSHHSLRIAW